MACYHPLRAFTIGSNTNGKRDLKVCSSDTYGVYKANGSWYPFGSREGLTDAENRLIALSHGTYITDSMLIPCGQCIGCRFKYARDWATRMMLESKDYEENYFLTLTYNDDNLPYSDGYFNAETGEVVESIPTLKPDDVTRFLKRLRKYQDTYFDNKIRYYMCGEYGDKTARPHYHLIVFGLHIDDLVFYKTSFNGDDYYTSDTITNIWNNGHVIIANVCWKSCAYVSRYVTKKAFKANDVYDYLGIQREYVRMSRNPGIARNYLEKNAEKLLDDMYIQLSDGDKAPLPKYFDNYLEEIYPIESAEVKQHREEVAKILQENKIRNSDLNYFDLLKLEEKTAIRKNTALERSSI